MIVRLIKLTGFSCCTTCNNKLLGLFVVTVFVNFMFCNVDKAGWLLTGTRAKSSNRLIHYKNNQYGVITACISLTNQALSL